jgi:ELWxxDGT repeat protein
MDPAHVARRIRRTGLRLFFVADSGRGQQLWVTDGTGAGTRMVKDLGPGGAGDPTAVGSVLYFTSDASQGTRQYPRLFESDGTGAGTRTVKGARGGFGTLGASDGTAAGTTLVQDIDQGPGPSDAMALTELGGMLIVAADDGTHGLELLGGPVTPAVKAR